MACWGVETEAAALPHKVASRRGRGACDSDLEDGTSFIVGHMRTGPAQVAQQVWSVSVYQQDQVELYYINRVRMNIPSPSPAVLRGGETLGNIHSYWLALLNYSGKLTGNNATALFATAQNPGGAGTLSFRNQRKVRIELLSSRDLSVGVCLSVCASVCGVIPRLVCDSMAAVCKTNPVHSAGAGVQTANSETAQTIHDPDAHDPSQGYSLLALLALIADKMTN